MEIKIEQVYDRKGLREFIRFPHRLYRDNEFWVPPLEGDEYRTFTPRKNDAYGFCECECFLARVEGVVVGRVAVILNTKANEKWKEDTVRFGWLDFIENQDVLDALLDKVEEFASRHGCTTIKGPLGFTDMDKEGLLVEGFERLSSFTCLYNFPYYGEMLEKAGYCKDTDWTQRTIKVPEQLPRMFEYCETISRRYGLEMARSRTMKELAKRYGRQVFEMYNETFAPIYESSPLSDRQIEEYLKTYVPIMDRDFASVCVDAEDRPAGFAFCVPSLSSAIKKSGGRLFPLGFLRILRALKKNDTIEAMLLGVAPQYQGRGAAILLLDELHRNCLKRGIKRIIMNPQLEDNFKVLSLFDAYETELYTRRRSYMKTIHEKS